MRGGGRGIRNRRSCCHGGQLNGRRQGHITHRMHRTVSVQWRGCEAIFLLFLLLAQCPSLRFCHIYHRGFIRGRFQTPGRVQTPGKGAIPIGASFSLFHSFTHHLHLLFFRVDPHPRPALIATSFRALNPSSPLPLPPISRRWSMEARVREAESSSVSPREP